MVKVTCVTSPVKNDSSVRHTPCKMSTTIKDVSATKRIEDLNKTVKSVDRRNTARITESLEVTK